VTAVGQDVTGFEVGDLVAVGAGVSCGACPQCLAGQTNLCLTYWTVGLHGDGGLAEEAVVPASCVWNVAGSAITPDLAALAQPMSIGVHATGRGRVTNDDRVVVLGAGGIGSFIIRAATTVGASVTAMDLDADRLEVARRLGAESALDASGGGFERLTEEGPPDVVFECTGRPESLVRAANIVADHGRLVVVGHQADPVALDFRQIALDELELIGTQAHVFAGDLPTAVDLIAADPEIWVSVAPHVLPLDQVVEAGLIPMAKGESGQIKTLFDPVATAPRPLDTGA
jgi:(R,R)-butanediol dehydrogenase/meso-butanediol dehydrogenase/diacetyl reductase